MIFPRKPRALILSHEPTYDKAFISMMPLLNWDCEIVTSPERALARLQASHFDALFTNYHMPHGNGLHFICCLRRDGIMVPAIIMSENIEVLRYVPKNLLTIPAAILKPFTISELRETLATIVSA
jgi:DNA-binding NtrC family response regulator